MLGQLERLLDVHEINHGPLTPGPAHLNLSATDQMLVHMKVGRADAWADRAQVEVSSALWARAHSVEVAEPLLRHANVCLDDANEPRPVTVWRALGREHRRPDLFGQVAVLSGAVASLAQIAPPVGAPRFALDRFTDRVTGRLAGDASPMARLLLGALDEVLPAAEEALAQSPVAWMHGDLHPENLYWVARGPVVIDWESSCVGPVVWDVGQVTRSAHSHPGLGGSPTDRLAARRTVERWAGRTFGLTPHQVEAVAAFRAVSAASHLHVAGDRPDHLASATGFLQDLGFDTSAVAA